MAIPTFGMPILYKTSKIPFIKKPNSFATGPMIKVEFCVNKMLVNFFPPSMEPDRIHPLKMDYILIFSMQQVFRP